VTNGSRRNPGKDFLDFVIGQARARGSAEDGKHIRCHAPTLLMTDESEIHPGLALFPGYTGNCVTH
jgi:hypothetical protein